MLRNGYVAIRYIAVDAVICQVASIEHECMLLTSIQYQPRNAGIALRTIFDIRRHLCISIDMNNQGLQMRFGLLIFYPVLIRESARTRERVADAFGSD